MVSEPPFRRSATGVRTTIGVTYYMDRFKDAPDRRWILSGCCSFMR